MNGKKFSNEIVCIAFKKNFGSFYNTASTIHNPPLMLLQLSVRIYA